MLLYKKRVDVIIVDSTKVWLPFVFPLKILDVPIVLDIRTLPIDRDKSLFFNISIYLSQFFVDGITTITQELSEVLKTDFNLKYMKIGIWSSGVSIDDFSEILDKRYKQVEKNNQLFTLLYIGDYSSTRGIENSIKAIALLDSSIKNNIRFFIIGMPENKIKLLSDLSENEGVKGNINIFPKVEYNKINEYLKIADVGVVFLPPENRWWRVSAPLKTLEYLAAGKPIFATDIPFHRNILNMADCGILLENANPDTIAQGISLMYKNKNDLIKMGDEGRRVVKQFFTWDIMAKKFEDSLINFSKQAKY
jgi:glycosyltransferase involved in cell wall biosynthesis